MRNKIFLILLILLIIGACQPQTIFVSIFVTEKYILASDMQHMLIFNKSPVQLFSSTKIGGWTYSIMLQTDVIYVACEGKGIRVYDIKDPTRLRLLSTFKTGGKARKLILKDEKLFVANSLDKVLILEVSNPQVPQLVSEFRIEPNGDSISDIELEAELLYVSAWEEGLIVLEVSKPSDPRIMGRYPISDARRSSSKRFGDLEVKNKIAYIEALDLSSRQATLQIFDVTNPSQPRLVKSIDPEAYMYRSVLHNAYIFATASVFPTHDNAIKVFSIVEPKTAQLINTWPVSNARLLAVDSDTVYIATDLEIKKYDFSNPLQPVHLLTYDRSQEFE